MTQFTYKVLKDGRVRISWRGREVVVLDGDRAQRFRSGLEKADGDQAAIDLLLARMTGNFKRGNERVARRRSRRD